MSEQELTADEKKLIELVLKYAHANRAEDSERTDSIMTTILAHYRKVTGYWLDAAMAMTQISKILADHGCDCECGHHHEEHDEDCDLGVGCKVSAVLHEQEHNQRMQRVAEIQATIDAPSYLQATPVYTATDGSRWVEDPDGTHGWWSERPGAPDEDGDTFDPWGRSIGDDAHGTESGRGTFLRYYRRVEKR